MKLKLSNDRRDTLIKWLEQRAESSTCAREKIAYLETLAFIKTRGQLK